MLEQKQLIEPISTYFITGMRKLINKSFFQKVLLSLNRTDVKIKFLYPKNLLFYMQFGQFSVNIFRRPQDTYFSV